MKPSLRLPGVLVNLGLGLAVTGLVGAALEGAARWIEARRAPRAPVADYIWDWDEKMPGGFYAMKSDAAGWPPWEEFNGDGLRDRTRPHEKPDVGRRLAVLGDSVTLGAEIRPDQAYPQQLEARLAEQGRPLEVMNVALWGWSTRQQRIAWQRIARAYAPDAVLLAVCLNDIPELFNNLERPPRWLTALHERSAVVRLAVDARGREIDSVERLFADEGTPRVRLALERFLDEVRALRREVEVDGASFALVVFPFRFQLETGAPPPVVQRRIATFCGDEGLRCLDMMPALAALGPGKAFVDYDHLSPEGAAATAEALLRGGLVPQVPSARELLEKALAGGAGAASLASWLPAGGRPLADDTPSQEAVQALASLLSSADAPTRRAAAWTLRLAGPAGARARPALARALQHDPSTAVRGAAAAALGATSPRAQAIPLLVSALDDPSEVVRHESAKALHALGLTAAELPLLVEALANRDDYVAAFATWSLGNLGGQAREAVPALARALERDKLEAVGAMALARIGPSAADAVPALIEALGSSDADRRWRAARTLGRIGAPAASAVERLAAALEDENGAVRQHSARALGRIGGEARRAAAALQRATGDPDQAVRREARQALERLQ